MAVEGGIPHPMDPPTPWITRSGNAPASTDSIRAASSTWLGVPLPRHSRNNTGNATGEEQNGS
jgi:hypothetical protein